MKVICDGLDLSDAVLKVSKALSVKATNPVLEGIRLVAENDSLTLTATDTELTIIKTIKADVLMEGETVVVGKYFTEFVKKLENEQVELSRLFDGQLQIKYSDSESELSVFDAGSFPIINDEDEENFIEITESEFKKIVEKNALACSTDDSRPILKGCLFEVEDGNLTTVALDGFRMSVIKKQVVSSGNFKAIIPVRTLVEITRLIEKEENIKLVINKNTLSVAFNNTKVYSRLIEGEFVKYNHILPSTFTNVVTINKNAFITSIERASIVARNDKYNIVKFDIKEDSMTILAKSEVGNVNEKVTIKLDGKDMVIAFNGKYLIDYLKTIDEDFVNIKLNSPIDPCVLTSSISDDFIYLVLPVRINA